VRNRSLIVLIASIVMMLSAVAISCTPTVGTPTPTPTQPAATTTPTPTPTPTQTAPVTDKKYNALNPRGIPQPVNIIGLAARLDTLDGKNIYIVQGEADPVIMPALNERMKTDYPKANIVYYLPQSSFGPSTPDATTLADAKAVIRGVGW